MIAWMDLADITVVPAIDSADFRDAIGEENWDELRNIADPDDRRTRATQMREDLIEVIRTRQRNAFPLAENLVGLIFLAQADLKEQQRERCVSSMTLRQIPMPNYTYQNVKELFMEVFCTTRTSIQDPQLQQRRRSTFLVLEDGELEGEEGLWVVDEETQEEGFISLYTEDEFWVLQAKGGYVRKRVHGRTFKRSGSKGKGKRKGKRPGFRARSRGKGYSTESFENYPDNSSYYQKGKGKKGKKGNKGKDDAYKGWSKGCNKGFQKGKGDKGKHQPSQANVASSAPQQPTQVQQPAESSAERPSYVAEDSWGYQEPWNDNTWSGWYGESYDDYYSWNDYSYYVMKHEHGRTDPNADRSTRKALMSHVRHYGLKFVSCLTEIFMILGVFLQFVCERSFDKVDLNNSCVEDHTELSFISGIDDCMDDFVLHQHETDITVNSAYLNYEHEVHQSLLCEYVDLAQNPTYVILDSGCTRAMGSRFAIDRLVRACKQHKNSDQIWFSTEAANSKFSFANGEQSTVKERLIIHIKNSYSSTGWITARVDILDKGRVPILFSVEQMRNLRMSIEHTPVGELMTCPLFGMKRTPLPVSTSNHPALDIMFLATSKSKPQYSFQSSSLYCPACNGKHRPHTYKDDCKRAPPKDEPVKPEPTLRLTKKTTTVVEKPSPKLVAKKQPDPDSAVPILRQPRAPDQTSGPSSSSWERPAEVGPDPQPAEAKSEEVKQDVRVEEREEPSSSMTLPLALQRIHQKLSSPTELLKLHLKHYHMSLDQFKKRTSALKIPKEIMKSMKMWLSSVRHVRSPRLHQLDPRSQESEVKLSENLRSLIMEKFH